MKRWGAVSEIMKGELVRDCDVHHQPTAWWSKNGSKHVRSSRGRMPSLLVVVGMTTIGFTLTRFLLGGSAPSIDEPVRDL
jgi:hypothetical protein